LTVEAFAKVYQVIQLMHPAGEWLPFRRAIETSPAAFELIDAYAAALAEGKFTEATFTAVLRAFEALGDGKPKWTVFTYWPYVATTRGFAFLKPTVTTAAAAGLGLAFNYEARVNWLTYQQTVALFEAAEERLKPIGCRDWVDVQSFLWLGWGK
jgi:hypothetical protein